MFGDRITRARFRYSMFANLDLQAEKQLHMAPGCRNGQLQNTKSLFNERRVVLSSRPTIVAWACNTTDHGSRRQSQGFNCMAAPSVSPCLAGKLSPPSFLNHALAL